MESKQVEKKDILDLIRHMREVKENRSPLSFFIASPLEELELRFTPYQREVIDKLIDNHSLSNAQIADVVLPNLETLAERPPDMHKCAPTDAAMLTNIALEKDVLDEFSRRRVIPEKLEGPLRNLVISRLIKIYGVDAKEARKMTANICVPSHGSEFRIAKSLYVRKFQKLPPVFPSKSAPIKVVAKRGRRK